MDGVQRTRVCCSNYSGGGGGEVATGGRARSWSSAGGDHSRGQGRAGASWAVTRERKQWVVGFGWLGEAEGGADGWLVAAVSGTGGVAMELDEAQLPFFCFSFFLFFFCFCKLVFPMRRVYN